ncbi:MAG: glycosyltransferase [Candidatus Omnitrophica bacterium]|nr:glycosyltransferase [Candidatus Omnitrophota bacterium]MBU4478122.1 glycosyltransferase [Candidatus Omnitrophota bacterium]MCG2704041.1 glycosyltransferase [Candidatus Omnitrophota bacterium]
MEKTPFISIIIPVRNAERTLEKTFEYILNVKYPRDKMEMVIADGGSTDKTLAVIKQWQKKQPFIKLVEVLNCPSPGYARNKALEAVKGEFIFFTDGDCAPCETWITDMLNVFEKDPRIGIVGGEIYTLRVDPDNLTELYCEHFRFNMVAPRYGFTIKEGYFPALTDRSPTQIAGHRAYFFVTANAAYRKTAIDEAKARFWEEPTGEDMEFGLQIQNHGWKLYFEPKAKVDHMHRANFPALKKVWVTYGMAHAPLLAKHAGQKLDIVFQIFGAWPNLPLISLPFPVKGFIYIGNFHIMHITGLLAVIGIVLFALGIGVNISLWLAVISALLTLYYVRRYFDVCLLMKPHKHFFTWCRMKYMTNLMFFIGGLKRSQKFKAFCIEPSF